MTGEAFAVVAALVATLVGWELLAARARGRSIYRLGPSLSNGVCAALRVGADASTRGLTVVSYAWIHGAFGIAELDAASPWTWLAGFVLYDFVYYWDHRSSHAVPLLWAGHSVHHQSSDFNLLSAFRASVVSPLLTIPFFWILAVAGVPPLVFVVVLVLHTLCLLGTHARLGGDLGPLGLVLNTPSYHRVHHSRCAEHRHRNFGGILIVWDRAFGTFAPESTPPRFGAGAELLDPVRANWIPFRELFRSAISQRSVTQGLSTLLLRDDGAAAERGRVNAL